MKKILCVVLAVLMLAMNIYAFGEGRGLPPDETFEAARECVYQLSCKQFDRASQALGGGISAKELRRVVDSSCKWLYNTNAQRDIAVAWQSGGVIYMAVPFEQPNDSFADALLFTLTSGFRFTEMRYCLWAEVMDGYGASANVRWHLPYSPDYTIFVD